MTPPRASQEQRLRALKNCIRLGQPKSLVPHDAKLCEDLLEGQALAIDRIERFERRFGKS